MDELEDIARRRYRTMKDRFKARYDKLGRCYRPPLTVPFTLPQFVKWLHELLDATGTTRCVYCNWPVNLRTMHLDHRQPIAQGGGLELANLAPTCAECNLQKGELTEGAFLELRALITNDPKFRGITRFQFTAHDCTDIKARLQSQLKLAIQQQRRIRKSQQTVRVVPHRRQRSA